VFLSSINNIFTCLKLDFDESFVAKGYTSLCNWRKFLKFCFHKV